MDKEFLTVKDLMAMGLSRHKADNLMNRSDAPVVRIGKKKYMLAGEFRDWLHKLAMEGGAK